MKLPSAKITLTIIVAVIYTIVLTTLLAAQLRTNHTLLIPGLGNIVTLGYDVDNRTIDWGTVYVGTSTDHAINLTSRSNTVTTPELSYGNWTFQNAENQPAPPPSVNNMTLSWSLNNDTQIEPNQKINVTLTLTAEYDSTFVDYLINNTIATFSFDIIIHPSQV
jgi:predicted membrane metal-binding protein